MYADWSPLRGNATTDRLGRCNWKSKLWGVGPLRDSLSLAISPFHGDRMVVPRRLRESRLLCIASPRQARFLCQLDDDRASYCPYPSEHSAFAVWKYRDSV